MTSRCSLVYEEHLLWRIRRTQRTKM